MFALATSNTMVAVLPWHDPVRLAEQIIMLDNLSNGRLLLGMGRGTGVVEFDGLRVEMGEARQRFKESAEAILEALETGYIEYDGEYIKQPRTAIRPGPFKSFKGRTYSATISPESAEIMARLGTGILIVPQKPWNQTQQDCLTYTRTYLDAIGEEPPSPICSGWTFVHEDAEKAEEMARQYVGGYWRSIVDHYEFDKPHLKSTPGYEFHSLMYDRLNAPNGLQRMTDFYIGLQPWGTPEQVVEKIRGFCEITGANTFVGNFRFGGMSYQEAESSMRLFAGEVMPALRQMEFSSPLPMPV